MRRLFFAVSLCAAFGLASCSNTVGREKYPVFFEQASVKLTGAARKIVERAAADARYQNAKRVEVIGFARAHGGNLSADELIAVKRAQAVADLLSEIGVGRAKIVQVAHPPQKNHGAAVALRLVTIEIDPTSP